MSLSIIAAMDQNQLIGNEGKLPWTLPADLEYFKKTTMGAPVVMGRKTYESIGSALPGRRNIILTRSKDYTAEGCEVFNSQKEVLEEFLDSKEEVFIIGGSQVYKTFLPFSSKLYLTVIKEEFYGDTYFPNIRWTKWIRASKTKGTTNMNNPYLYTYNIFHRREF